MRAIILQIPAIVPLAIVFASLACAFILSRKWTGASWRRKAWLGAGIVGTALVAFPSFGLALFLGSDWVVDANLLSEWAAGVYENYVRWCLLVLDQLEPAIEV